MPVLVKLSASLRGQVRGYDPLAGLEVEHRPGLDPAGVMRHLGINAADVKIIMINGLSGEADTPLADGDRLGLFPPVGGG